jgi:hypothetical protein
MASDFKIDLSTQFEKKMALNEEKYPVEKSRGSAAKYRDID